MVRDDIIQSLSTGKIFCKEVHSLFERNSIRTIARLIAKQRGIHIHTSTRYIMDGVNIVDGVTISDSDWPKHFHVWEDRESTEAERRYAATVMDHLIR